MLSLPKWCHRIIYLSRLLYECHDTISFRVDPNESVFYFSFWFISVSNILLAVKYFSAAL
jgi:hypothetical protein